jgi:hypothetical protein
VTKGFRRFGVLTITSASDPQHPLAPTIVGTAAINNIVARTYEKGVRSMVCFHAEE